MEHCVWPVADQSNNVSRHWYHDIDLLFIDGDHTLPGVRNDLFGFYPFLNEGGRLLMHDVLADRSHLVDVWESLIEHTLQPELNFKGLCQGVKQFSVCQTQWILIPTYNENKQLKRQLNLLEQIDTDKQKLVIVDDGDDVELKTFISQNHPGATYVAGDGENYWGGSIDLGLNAIMSEMKSDDLVFLINADGLITSSVIERLRQTKLNHPFKNAAFGFECYTAEGSRRIANAGHVTWSQRELGRTASGPLNRGKANLVTVDAVFGRISVFPATLFVEHEMRFGEDGFKHYWSDTVFA